eukprot:14149014-Alexandrium_andersonii.AAC.1
MAYCMGHMQRRDDLDVGPRAFGAAGSSGSDDDDSESDGAGDSGCSQKSAHWCDVVGEGFSDPGAGGSASASCELPPQPDQPPPAAAEAIQASQESIGSAGSLQRDLEALIDSEMLLAAAAASTGDSAARVLAPGADEGQFESD